MATSATLDWIMVAPALTRNAVWTASSPAPAMVPDRRSIQGLRRWAPAAPVRPGSVPLRDRLTQKRKAAAARPDSVSTTGQMKLWALIERGTGFRSPRPKTHRTRRAAAATPKDTPSQRAASRDRPAFTTRSTPNPASTARAKASGINARTRSTLLSNGVL